MPPKPLRPLSALRQVVEETSLNESCATHVVERLAGMSEAARRILLSLADFVAFGRQATAEGCGERDGRAGDRDAKVASPAFAPTPSVFPFRSSC